MGTFSIYHWIIVLLMIAVIVAIAVAISKLTGKNRAKGEAIQGLGGWLLFFIITLFLSTFRTLGEFYIEKSKTLTSFPDAMSSPEFRQLLSSQEVLTWVMALLFTLSAFLLICVRKRWVVKVVVAALWLSIFGGYAASLFLLHVIAPEEQLFYPEDAKNLITGMTYPLIWTMYLFRSKRVENTYQERGHDSAISFLPPTA